MYVNASPSQSYPSVHFHTPGWRKADQSVLPRNTTLCPRPGLEPGPLDPETSALTMRPPRLPHLWTQSARKKCLLFAIFSCSEKLNEKRTNSKWKKENLNV